MHTLILPKTSPCSFNLIVVKATRRLMLCMPLTVWVGGGVDQVKARLVGQTATPYPGYHREDSATRSPALDIPYRLIIPVTAASRANPH